MKLHEFWVSERLEKRADLAEHPVSLPSRQPIHHAHGVRSAEKGPAVLAVDARVEPVLDGGPLVPRQIAIDERDDARLAEVDRLLALILSKRAPSPSLRIGASEPVVSALTSSYSLSPELCRHAFVPAMLSRFCELIVRRQERPTSHGTAVGARALW